MLVNLNEVLKLKAYKYKTTSKFRFGTWYY